VIRSLAPLLAVLLAGCTVVTGQEQALSGREVYERNCARCHGKDGRGTKDMPSAKDLTNATAMRELPDERLRGVIMEGKPPNMPAFGGELMEPSLKVLVAYVRSLSDPEAVGATRPPGERAAAEDAAP
jgi:cytochrome c oxidase cbb3-type subunit 3